MPDNEEIVEHLRTIAGDVIEYGPLRDVAETCSEAATTIERLTAERDEARREAALFREIATLSGEERDRRGAAAVEEIRARKALEDHPNAG